MRKLLVVVSALALVAGGVLVASAVREQAWKPTKAQIEAAKKIRKPVVFTNSIGMKFVLIPAGSFMMGSPFDELERNPSECRHRVVISRPYYLQTTEVTQAQYRRIMGKNPSRFKGCDQCPVEFILYDDAREFIRRLNAREKTNKYRLPTEAEWEYACRAGTTTPFYFGATISPNLANYNGHSVYGHGRKGVWRRRPIPVGYFAPNAWGLYDMHGNVSEWCSDWYGIRYYAHSPTRDPQGSMEVDHKVVRGGSWIAVPEALRSAARDDAPPEAESADRGFRVVLALTARGVRPAPAALKRAVPAAKVRPGAGVAPAALKHCGKPTPARPAYPWDIRPLFAFTNSIGMRFVLIPAGHFLMGSPPSEFHRKKQRVGPNGRLKTIDDEQQHRVMISRPFYMQVTEVTQAQYRAIMGKNPSFYQCCDRCPVETVSWPEAREFIRRLNAREGTNKYRLPTEAEWEYACRAGTTTPFSFGSTISTRQANYLGKWVYGRGWQDTYVAREKTMPVKSFPPNPWGLYEMHGNVQEWCSDWYGTDYYRASPTVDPRGPSSGQFRVVRGGSFPAHPWQVRSAYRKRMEPTIRDDETGFRVVRDF